MAQDDYIKLQVRVPRELHAALQSASEDSGRSLNGEIVTRLAQTIETPRMSQIVQLLEAWSAATGKTFKLEFGTLEVDEDD